MKSERASGHLPRASANYELEGKKKIRGNLDSNADTSMKITRRSKSKMGGGIRNPPRSNLPSLGEGRGGGGVVERWKPWAGSGGRSFELPDSHQLTPKL